MADIYFKQTSTIDGKYWRLIGVKNVKPAERSQLSLICQEYLAISGDIGSSKNFVDAAMQHTRQELQSLGHTLHYDPPMNESSLIDGVINHLLEDDDGWIGVDFDGTLAKHTKYKGPTKLGEPIPKMVARVRRWVGHGKKVKIFTARADDERSVNAIKKWLKNNELPDLEITNLKDHHMTEIWDDNAITVKKNTGEVAESLILTQLIESDEGDVNWKDVTNPPFKIGTRVICNNEADEFFNQEGIVERYIGEHDEEIYWVRWLNGTVLGYTRDELTPLNVQENQIYESPEIKTLKKNAKPLDPEERAQVMKAGAVWHHGPNGEATPAVRKAVVRGKTWYWCATHRYGQVRSTLAAAIKTYPSVEATA